MDPTELDEGDGFTYPTMGAFLDIAGLVLNGDPAAIERMSHIDLAETALLSPRASFGGVAAYPTLADKAAVLGWHLTNNHALPDGNKRAALVTMIEFIEANGAVWRRPDSDDAVGIMLAVAAGQLDLDAFTVWVRAHVTEPT